MGRGGGEGQSIKGEGEEHRGKASELKPVVSHQLSKRQFDEFRQRQFEPIEFEWMLATEMSLKRTR